MSADKHEITFEWPFHGPSEVIITGSFDNWARSKRLTRTPNGFTGKVAVPWNSKVTYKYIVDGYWATAAGHPTEWDGSGNINNVLMTPAKPASLPVPQETPAVPKPTSAPIPDVSPIPTSVADVVPTAAIPSPQPESIATPPIPGAFEEKPQSQTESTPAANGTAYSGIDAPAATTDVSGHVSTVIAAVTSTVGAAIETVTGLKPINGEQVPADAEAPQGVKAQIDAALAGLDVPPTVESSKPELEAASVPAAASEPEPAALADAAAAESLPISNEKVAERDLTPTPTQPPVPAAEVAAPPQPAVEAVPEPTTPDSKDVLAPSSTAALLEPTSAPATEYSEYSASLTTNGSATTAVKEPEPRPTTPVAGPTSTATGAKATPSPPSSPSATLTPKRQSLPTRVGRSISGSFSRGRTISTSTTDSTSSPPGTQRKKRKSIITKIKDVFHSPK